MVSTIRWVRGFRLQQDRSIASSSRKTEEFLCIKDFPCTLAILPCISLQSEDFHCILMFSQLGKWRLVPETHKENTPKRGNITLYEIFPRSSGSLSLNYVLKVLGCFFHFITRLLCHLETYVRNYNYAKNSGFLCPLKKKDAPDFIILVVIFNYN